MIARRRLRLMLVLLAGSLSAVAAFCWIANPYGVWRVSLIDPGYRGPARSPCSEDVHERVLTPYRLRTEQSSTVLLGSSRVLCGVPIDPDLHGDILNAGLGGARIDELVSMLRACATTPHVRRVILAVDFFAFQERLQGYQDPDLPLRLRGTPLVLVRDALAGIKENLLNLEVLNASWRVLLRRLGGMYTPPSPPAPWPEPIIAARLESPDGGLHALADDQVNWRLNSVIDIYRDYRQVPDNLDALRKAVQVVRGSGRDVTVVMFPQTVCELEVIRRSGLWEQFQQWQRVLLAAVGPYWDFSGYNDATRMEALFTDLMHLQPAAGHVILRQLLNIPCAACGARAQMLDGAAVWVDASTIDTHLAEQNRRRDAEAYAHSRCARLVQAAFAARDGRAVPAAP